MKSSRIILFFVIVILVCGVIISMLAPKVHKTAGISIAVGPDSVKAIAQQFAHEQGFDLKGFFVSAELQYSSSLIKQVQETFGLEKGNSLLRDSIPGYYWVLSWHKIGEEMISISRNQTERAMLGGIDMHMNTYGRLLEYKRSLEDTVRLPLIPPSEARILAERFISTHSYYRFAASEKIDTSALNTQHDIRGPQILQFESEETIQRPTRTDYRFRWVSWEPSLGDSILVSLQVAGNTVTQYSTEYVVPQKYERQEMELITTLLPILFFTVIIIIMIVVAIKRLRSYEIGFKIALVVGIIAALFSVLDLFSSLSGTGWGLIFALIFTPLFVGGALILAWAISESMGREQWREKFISIDLLTKGYLLESNIGKSILAGIAGGAGLFALWLTLTWVAQHVSPLWYSLEEKSHIRFLGVSSPSLQILGHNLYNSFYILSTAIIFPLSLVRKRYPMKWILYTGGALFSACIDHGQLFPLSAGMVISALQGIFLVWIWLEFDVLALLTVLFSSAVIENGVTLIMAGNSGIMYSVYTLVLFFGILSLWAVVTLLTKNRVTDYDSIIPAFARHITERQRLQRELEIAREVQNGIPPEK